MSLIAECKRRKVFKLGAAYRVAAWLAVQSTRTAPASPNSEKETK
jgi:hypothetical protein